MYSSAELFSAHESVILCVFAELQSYERNKQNQHSSEHRKKVRNESAYIIHLLHDI